MKDLVIYHKNCADGFCAAFLFWLQYGDEVEYVGVDYSNEELPPVDGRRVYIVDYSYDYETLKSHFVMAKELVILDHHSSSKEDLLRFKAEHEGLETVHVNWDSTRSGAMLTYNYLHSFNPEWHDSGAPTLVRYVQDRDLWKWELPSSDAYNAYISSLPFTFEAWHQMSIMNPQELVGHGFAILGYQQRMIERICESAVEITIRGHKVLAANTPILQSEVAGQLAAGREFGVAWYQVAEGVYRYSLRVRDGDFDVSKLAEEFDGGGHKKAARFDRPVPPALGN